MFDDIADVDCINTSLGTGIKNSYATSEVSRKDKWANLDDVVSGNRSPARDSCPIQVNTVCRAGIEDYDALRCVHETRVVIRDEKCVELNVVVLCASYRQFPSLIKGTLVNKLRT